MMRSSRNDVLLAGTVQAPPVFSHENHGIRFFRLILQVPRLSGQMDLLPVLLAEHLLPQAQGPALRIQGQLRSFNNKSGQGNKLVLSVHARTVCPDTEGPENQVRLSGVICKVPIFRRTPLGRSICDLMLAVQRPYGRSDYLPVIAWGQLAVQAAAMEVGDPLSAAGRFQSRIYRKVTDLGIEERTAYEVSVMHLAACQEPVCCFNEQ